MGFNHNDEEDASINLSFHTASYHFSPLDGIPVQSSDKNRIWRLQPVQTLTCFSYFCWLLKLLPTTLHSAWTSVLVCLLGLTASCCFCWLSGSIVFRTWGKPQRVALNASLFHSSIRIRESRNPPTKNDWNVWHIDFLEHTLVINTYQKKWE